MYWGQTKVPWHPEGDPQLPHPQLSALIGQPDGSLKCWLTMQERLISSFGEEGRFAHKEAQKSESGKHSGSPRTGECH